MRDSRIKGHRLFVLNKMLISIFWVHPSLTIHGSDRGDERHRHSSHENGDSVKCTLYQDGLTRTFSSLPQNISVTIT